MESRLFVFTNKTHFLNVKTYIETHPEAKNYVVLNIRSFKGYENFVEEVKNDADMILLQTFLVDYKKGFPWNYLDSLQKILQIKMLKKKHSYFDKVFFTTYFSWIEHCIVQQFQKKQTILISDGTAIFHVINHRKENPGRPAIENSFFTEKILGLKPIKHLHFYSQIPVEVPETDTYEVFNFKSASGKEVNPKKIYFVGSPLVEHGYLYPEKNLQYLKQVRDQFPESYITYFAHRRENEKNLEEYKDFAEVRRDTIPFEDRMSKEEELPGTVLSYISSVLINLPQVFPEVEFYFLPLRKEDIPDQSFIRRYDELEKNFLKIKSPNFTQFGKKSEANPTSASKPT